MFHVAGSAEKLLNSSLSIVDELISVLMDRIECLPCKPVDFYCLCVWAVQSSTRGQLGRTMAISMIF